MNEDPAARLIKNLEALGTLMSVLKAENSALTTICGSLMAEIARLSPEPQAALDRMAGLLTGSAEKALARFGAQEAATAQTEMVDKVIGIAEAALDQPPKPSGERG
jgi:hypothetical protein